MVKFYMYISPIFSCRVTFVAATNVMFVAFYVMFVAIVATDVMFVAICCD